MKKFRRSSASSTGWPRSRKASRNLRILVDRSLSKSIARGLRTFGFTVVTLDDVYGNDGQHVPDVQWIQDAAAHGYVVFMANPYMRSVAVERDLILAVGAKIFSIANPNQTRDGRALIFGRHLLRIIRRAKEPGPCLWRLSPSAVIIRDIP